MPRFDKGFGSIPAPNPQENPHHGHGHGQCSSQVWYATVKIMGSQAKGDIVDGSIIRHDPFFQ